MAKRAVEIPEHELKPGETAIIMLVRENGDIVSYVGHHPWNEVNSKEAVRFPERVRSFTSLRAAHNFRRDRLELDVAYLGEYSFQILVRSKPKDVFLGGHTAPGRPGVAMCKVNAAGEPVAWREQGGWTVKQRPVRIRTWPTREAAEAYKRGVGRFINVDNWRVRKCPPLPERRHTKEKVPLGPILGTYNGQAPGAGRTAKVTKQGFVKLRGASAALKSSPEPRPFKGVKRHAISESTTVPAEAPGQDARPEPSGAVDPGHPSAGLAGGDVPCEAAV